MTLDDEVKDGEQESVVKTVVPPCVLPNGLPDTFVYFGECHCRKLDVVCSHRDIRTIKLTSYKQDQPYQFIIAECHYYKEREQQ